MVLEVSQQGDATPPESTATASMARMRVFVDCQAVSDFADENIVNVNEPWAQLLDHLESNRIALIRAPPKSGKTMLGELASLGRVEVVNMRRYEVRYCPFISGYANFLQSHGFPHVEAMALDSGASEKNSSRNTLVYFFDEVGEVPEEIYKYFIKKLNGYAVFASTSAPARARELGYITPAELLHCSFFYKSPTTSKKLSKWLARRFAALFGQLARSKEVMMATKLLLGVSDSHLGIIQYLGCRLEAARCKNLQDVRSFIVAALRSKQRIFYAARCFGVAGGLPTDAQSTLVSMLRCSGQMKFVDACGCLRGAWKEDNPEHRQGLVQGLYAPMVNVLQPLVPQEEEESIQMGFTHTLQPELYHSKFEVNDNWRELSQSHRWVVNFSHSDTEKAAKLPTHVVDLVVSWLSNIETVDLVYARDNVDASEDVFQRSLDEFCMLLGMNGRREVFFKTAHLKGFLDLLVNDTMGIELLIRTGGNNRYSATGLLEKDSLTWSALLQHASRTHRAYAGAAKMCNDGYITVLPATLTFTTVEREWDNFEAFIKKLRENKDTARALAYHIMVAVAKPGWGEFVVFLHEPGKEPVKFSVPRQRLMLKVVDGQPQSARHFYPRPEMVWAQRLLKGSDLQLARSALEVAPAKDSVASLAMAVAKEYEISPPDLLEIYQLNHAGGWELMEKDQVLYGNTEKKPYGFFVNEYG